MKYENPLAKTPCIKALVGVLLLPQPPPRNSIPADELLALGVANSRNTLYEILGALEKEGLISKDQTAKPMPIRPNIPMLLSLLKLRQVNAGLGAALLPKLKAEVMKKVKGMKNKRNVGELVALVNNINASVSPEALEECAAQVSDNTPKTAETLMRAFLEGLQKAKKKDKQSIMEAITLTPLNSFNEFLDSFFFALVQDGGRLKNRFKTRAERAEFAEYLDNLKPGWNTAQLARAMVERNKRLAAVFNEAALFKSF